MQITSAKFIKGLVGPDEILEDGKPQIAFIGRSNVGKSSVINTLTHQKNLAKTSSFPGRTQQINIFLVSAKGGSSFYLVDLPGYGFAKGSKDEQAILQQLIYWYLLDSPYKQKKVVLIVDAGIGPTNNDMQMLQSLEQQGKEILVVANKVDKIKKTEYKKQLMEIQNVMDGYKIIPYSAETKAGVIELENEILK